METIVPAIDQQSLHAGEPSEDSCKKDSISVTEANELEITYTF